MDNRGSTNSNKSHTWTDADLGHKTCLPFPLLIRILLSLQFFGGEREWERGREARGEEDRENEREKIERSVREKREKEREETPHLLPSVRPVCEDIHLIQSMVLACSCFLYQSFFLSFFLSSCSSSLPQFFQCLVSPSSPSVSLNTRLMVRATCNMTSLSLSLSYFSALILNHEEREKEIKEEKKRENGFMGMRQEEKFFSTEIASDTFNFLFFFLHLFLSIPLSLSLLFTIQLNLECFVPKLLFDLCRSFISCCFRSCCQVDQDCKQQKK